MGSDKKLTDKQEKFVQNLLLGQSQREAYKNSYNASNMKDNTIDRKAYEVFGKDYVRARFDILKAEIVEAVEEEFKLDAVSILKSIVEIREDAMELVVIKENEDGSKVYSMKDRFGALKSNELLGKHLKLFTDKVEHSGEISMPTIKITK